MIVTAPGIRFRFQPEGGFLTDLVISDHGRQIAPLYRAPWLAETLPADMPTHLRFLQGDFFCAPFCGHSDGSDFHGWPANGTWQVGDSRPGTVAADLPQSVKSARISKLLEVDAGHPWVYQTHRLTGGTGQLPVANHAMVALPNGGLIRTSPKAFWETSPLPQETDPARGRSALAYPARTADPRAFPRADGSVADLTRYPWTDRAEDFCAGVEAPGSALGWTAITRPAEGDLYLSLRNPAKLPMTMLWHSNYGRDYLPWSGRNRCLGVEEGAASMMLGLSADQASPGSLSLNPAGTVDVRHVIGAIGWPSGEAVAEILATGDLIQVRGEGGARRSLPFRGGFLS